MRMVGEEGRKKKKRRSEMKKREEDGERKIRSKTTQQNGKSEPRADGR
jgi:hypothetical protein